ncbi:putative secreted protein [Granulibacter bethesdensis]|uniref:Secreted protein n=1 Tax=Granulibacter bethesdensis TaxID=364410 RepID=A0AAN0RCQ2_9PROT|nr:putative secreted protein [Granulibacter bethesdensis]
MLILKTISKDFGPDHKYIIMKSLLFLSCVYERKTNAICQAYSFSSADHLSGRLFCAGSKRGQRLIPLQR